VKINRLKTIKAILDRANLPGNGIWISDMKKFNTDCKSVRFVAKVARFVGAGIIYEGE